MKQKTTGYRQLKDRTWEINTTVKVDNEYKHFQKKGYATLGAAKADFERAKEEFIKKHTKHHKIGTFDEVLEAYKRMRKSIVNESTLICDNSVYNVYLLPYFAGEVLKDVFNRDTINEWYHDIVDNPDYSSNKKTKVVARMKDILKFAYMHEYIDARTYQSCDVCLYPVKSSKKAQTERIVWTHEEEHKFLEACKDNYNDYLMFKLFFICAARLGEFLGLQVGCFDYAKGKITIKQQVAYDGELTDRLKSEESYRTIALPKDISNMLQEYIEELGLNSDDYIFHTYDRKTPISRTTFRRSLYKYCDIAEVRKLNPHAIRHTMAVRLARVCKTGAELETAAKRMGHTTSVFLDIYANHKDDEIENDLLNRMLG